MVTVCQLPLNLSMGTKRVDIRYYSACSVMFQMLLKLCVGRSFYRRSSCSFASAFLYRWLVFLYRRLVQLIQGVRMFIIEACSPPSIVVLFGRHLLSLFKVCRMLIRARSTIDAVPSSVPSLAQLRQHAFLYCRLVQRIKVCRIFVEACRIVRSTLAQWPAAVDPRKPIRVMIP
jgi:hypothetical protein